MKRYTNPLIFLFVVWALLMAGASPAAAESTGKLIINISGFPTSEGFAMVALHNSEESYRGEGDTAIAKTRAKVVDQEAQVVFFNLVYGWYGVSIFHDENANMKFDKYPMGIPMEAYGFSNDARGILGKPKYEKVKFQMNSAARQITINVD